MTISGSTPPRRSERATWLGELSATAILSGPFALTNLAQIGMSTTDIVMMGWLGADVLAAGALGTNLYFVPLIFGIGLLNALSPMIAHTLGRASADGAPAGDTASEVRRTVQQGFWLAACIAVTAWCVLWWGEAILRAMGQDAALAHAAGTYVRALQWSMLPFLAYLVLRAFTGTLERPGWALAISIAAVVVNAVGNWCLMLGRCGMAPMGIAGSGLATAIASTLMFTGLALVVTLDRRFRAYQLWRGWWRVDTERCRALLRLGLPLAATLSFEMTVFSAAVFLMGLLGPAPLAAHAIAVQIVAFTFMVPLGVGQAAAVRVGLAHGAANAGGVTRAGSAALLLAVGFMATMTLAILALTDPIVALFVDIADPVNADVAALARTFLAIAAIFQVADGAQAVGSGMLRGLHDTRMPMLFALAGYWGIGLPLGVALAFGLGLGGRGIWLGLAAGLAIVALLMLRRWHMRGRLGLVAA